MDQTLRVACAGFRGPHGRYWAQGLDALELDPAATAARPATLKKWRAAAPAHVRYVPAVDPAVAAARFEGEVARAAWARTCTAAELLGADTVLLHTRADFRPTRENQRRLTTFFDAAATGGLSVAWRAEGLWELEAREAASEGTSLRPVIDPLALDRDDEPIPESERVYWRLLGGTGMGTRFGDFELDRLIELCREREAQGYVVFAAPQMLRDARRFRLLLAMESGAEAPSVEGEEAPDELDFDDDALEAGEPGDSDADED